VKSLFDFFFSLFLLAILLPVFIVIAIIIRTGSNGPVFFLQSRVGKNNHTFKIIKFRTMYLNSEAGGQLTVGGNDQRITKAGYYLRKYKLDELPQLINVLKGEMSFVGPRPEVRKYVALYRKEQMEVLKHKPGITDYASIKFSNENDLLSHASDPEKLYIEDIMPRKIALSIDYMNRRNFFSDMLVMFITVKKIFTRH
jgi:lipopolysaccharide/colanic/teichoic acid biosynthesis glycosyltransferase